MAHERTLPNGTITPTAFSAARLGIAAATTTSKTLAQLSVAVMTNLAEITLRNESTTATLHLAIGATATTSSPSLPPGGSLTLAVTKEVADTLQVRTASGTANVTVLQLGDA